jgi:hypothetical protein
MTCCHLTIGDELMSSKDKLVSLLSDILSQLASNIKAGNGTPFNYS